MWFFDIYIKVGKGNSFLLLFFTPCHSSLLPLILTLTLIPLLTLLTSITTYDIMTSICTIQAWREIYFAGMLSKLYTETLSTGVVVPYSTNDVPVDNSTQHWAGG